MKYQYNYSFLGRWMAKNKGITINTILRAIGSTSNNSLRLWEQGKCPMPVTSILRFCNTFQVPISAFFCDIDNNGNTSLAYIPPSPNDQFEPDGGYVKERKVGSRALYDPLDVTIIPSVIPGVSQNHMQPNTKKNNEDMANINKPDASSCPFQNNSNINDKNMVAMLEIETKRIELEERYAKERIWLLDFIAELQKQNADLTNMLMCIKTHKVYEDSQDLPTETSLQL